jgi:hypothetical protein
LRSPIFSEKSDFWAEGFDWFGLVDRAVLMNWWFVDLRQAGFFAD